ncbi:MAG TPA: hypothetical protein VI278_04095 [Nitrososphaeraceae archaeon]
MTNDKTNQKIIKETIKSTINNCLKGSNNVKRIWQHDTVVQRFSKKHASDFYKGYDEYYATFERDYLNTKAFWFSSLFRIFWTSYSSISTRQPLTTARLGLQFT